MEAELIVRGGTVVPYSMELDETGDPVALAEAPAFTWADLGKSMIWRDITVAPLTIEPVQTSENGTLWSVTELELEIRTAGRMADAPPQPDRPVSEAFYPVYQSMLLNGLDELGERRAHRKGTYMMMVPAQYSSVIDGYVDWKTRLGYNVVVELLPPGVTVSDIQSIIEDAWENLDPTPDYVLLLGDEGRGATLPSHIVRNPLYTEENDATDWPYVTLEGDDYLPEMFIGRMTVGSASEARKALQRTIDYEQTPHLIPNPDRWNHVTLVAANYSESSLPPLTPVATSQWLGEHFENDWGITDVDTLFWRQSGRQISPSMIQNDINRGTMFVTYRGWGNSSGWVRPSFENANVDELQNFSQLPVVTSFVCNTGDFASPANGDKAFGEHWITAGSLNSPTGGVAFVGPTDLHTNTRYNNILLSGFYYGVYEDNMLHISQALMKSKTELWLGFPNEREVGGLPNNASVVQFYWSVYHVLGDPSLQMWRYEPRNFTINGPSSVEHGQADLTFTVRDEATGRVLPYAYVQVMQDGEMLDGLSTDESGRAVLNMTDAEPGELEVTVTRGDYEPYEFTLSVNQVSNMVGVDSWTLDAGADGMLNPGETADLVVTLANTGTSNQSNVSAVLSSNSPNVTVDQGSASFGAINAGATADNASAPFTVTIGTPIEDGTELEFMLDVEGSAGGPFSHTFYLPVSEAKLLFASHDVTAGNYQPGGTASINLTFENVSDTDAEAVSVTIEPWDEAVTMTTATRNIGNIPAGGEGTTMNPVQLEVNADTYSGRVVQYLAVFSSGGEVIDRTLFSMSLEGVQTTDPLGPDSYGYFAYDNTDTAWDEAPTYDWPGLGDSGADPAGELADDELFYTQLPFDFQYYGETYSAGTTITISSNGWISFTEEGNYTRLYFRNWHLPSVLGPTTIIAPFWDDLWAHETPGGTGVPQEVYTLHDEVNNTFIVEWPNATLRFGNDSNVFRAEFAVILFDPAHHTTPSGDGPIEFHYREADNVDETNNGASVGLEGENHELGIEYTYGRNYPAAAAPIEGGRAIRFTTTPPDNLNDIGIETPEALPTEFAVHPVYPNPFNSTARIRFDLPEAANVRVALYNTLGREIAVLTDGEMSPGFKQLSFDAASYKLSTGMMFLRVQANQHQAWQKMLFVK
ncbi:hypothetical protein GF324_03475 [bacterium]|nr:hypothetical protein [bacterium]